MQKPLLKKLNLLDNLNEDMKPYWGKMTPQHMIEHVLLTFRLSTGKLNTKCFSKEEKLPTLKRFLLSNRPLPKLFVSPAVGEDLLPIEFESLEKAKEALIEEVGHYYDYYLNNPDATHINPTFGTLNNDEWEVFHGKHLNHHFSQFGLIE